jgi:UDP-N-acetylmuramoylalanine--D-glutamate ligase
MSGGVPVAGERALVVGFGLHGRAVVAALAARGIDTVVVDDAPNDAARAAARAAGVELLVPSAVELEALVADVAAVVPTPGLPDAHAVFGFADTHGIPVLSEFDLAGAWDDRPIVAITGTNGKTTVTTMVTEMLVRSGLVAVMAGNTDVPLVTAIDDHAADVFVVEASSFRLGHSRTFRPKVATWLNFDPDHLDVHASLAAYERAKARIWDDQEADDVAVANAEDPIVMRNLGGRARQVTFGLSVGDACVVDDVLVIGGEPLIAASELARSLPHDRANALAAAVTALAAGAGRDAVRDTLAEFSGLAHRVALVGESRGVRWFDDSKATTPHAVLAGVGGFDSVVLIAGGRNKGVDLSPLGTLGERVHAVVAIGEATPEIAAAFAGGPPVRPAASMADAVRLAAGLARPGDAVVLSPACTSYDWYSSYAERGDDFAALVRRLVIDEEQAGD